MEDIFDQLFIERINKETPQANEELKKALVAIYNQRIHLHFMTVNYIKSTGETDQECISDLLSCGAEIMINIGYGTLFSDVSGMTKNEADFILDIYNLKDLEQVINEGLSRMAGKASTLH